MLQREPIVTLIMSEARRICRHLNIHSMINNIDHMLSVSLRLHSPAHISKGHQRLIILHHKPGNNRVKGTLSWSNDIR